MQQVRTQMQKKGMILQMFTTKMSNENKIGNEKVCVFKIQWKEPNKSKQEDVQYTYIQSGLAKINYPQLVIEFYEKKIKMKEVCQVKELQKNQSILLEQSQIQGSQNKILSFLNEAKQNALEAIETKPNQASLLDYDNIRDHINDTCKVVFTLAKTKRTLKKQQLNISNQQSSKQSSAEKEPRKKSKTKKRGKSSAKKAIR